MKLCRGNCGRKVTRHSKSGFCIHCFNKNTIGKKRPEGFKKDQSKRALEWYAANPEQKIIRRDRMRASWTTGAITPQLRKSPPRSKAELKFFDKLQEISPYEIKSNHTIKNSDGSWMMPDIVIPRLDLVIEFYGDYWHANPKKYRPNDMMHSKIASDVWSFDRIRESNILKQYELMIVWQSESEIALSRLARQWNQEIDPCWSDIGEVIAGIKQCTSTWTS